MGQPDLRHTARSGDAVREEVALARAARRVLDRQCHRDRLRPRLRRLAGRPLPRVRLSAVDPPPPGLHRAPDRPEPAKRGDRPPGQRPSCGKPSPSTASTTDVLQTLHPDVIITQAQCEVCAVSLQDVERSLAGWLASRPHLVSLEPNALADVWRDIDHVAEALGVPERGAALVTRPPGADRHRSPSSARGLA